MKMTKVKLFFSILSTLLIAFSACKPNIVNPAFSMGEIDASNYVAFGNDYTTGVLNNVISEDGQKNSFAALLAKQFGIIDSTIPFNLPLMPLGMMDKQLILEKLDSIYTGCPNKILLQGLHAIKPSIPIDALYGTFHNMGSPNMKIKDMPNSLIQKDLLRFIHQNTTYIDVAKSMKPSFFSVEMGFADVRNYARLGGTCNVGCMPSTRDFESLYKRILDSLKTTDNEGVIFTIPDITEMPYLTFGKNYFGQNNDCSSSFFYIEDHNGNISVAKNDEVFLLTELENIIKAGQGLDDDNPIRDFYCLDATEMKQLKIYIATYNNIIRQLAQNYDLALVDMNQIFHEINTSGYLQDGISLNNTYITGGFYSIDGYSLSPRGNAYITNRIIETLNTKYQANIPFLNLGDYPVVKVE